jgi:hypothetical protein
MENLAAGRIATAGSKFIGTASQAVSRGQTATEKYLANGRPKQIKRGQLKAILGSYPEEILGGSEFRMRPLNFYEVEFASNEQI